MNIPSLHGLIPEPDLLLAEAILDKYNSRLHCPQCNTKYSQDGTVFRRDQGGKRGKLYYRKYRCKGKGHTSTGNSFCSANIGVKEFIQVAEQDLGSAIIAQLRVTLNIPVLSPAAAPPRARRYRRQITNDTPVQLPLTPPRKRTADGFTTGYSPTSKRTDQRNSPVEYRQNDSNVDELLSRLKFAESQVQSYKQQAEEKQNKLDDLIRILLSSACL